jgi:hypothetical protein
MIISSGSGKVNAPLTLREEAQKPDTTSSLPYMHAQAGKEFKSNGQSGNLKTEVPLSST